MPALRSIRVPVPPAGAVVHAATFALALAGGPRLPAAQAADGAWHRIADPQAMPYGVAAAHAHDAQHQRLFVVSGDAVWSYGLAGARAWTRLEPAGTAPSHWGGTMIYDSGHDRLVLYPADDAGGVAFLELSPAPAWTWLEGGGPGPGHRAGHVAIYDPQDARMIVSGGGNTIPTGGVWQLTLGGAPQWSPVATSVHQAGLVWDATAAYDPVRHGMLLFRDRGFPDDPPSWRLDLTTHEWILLGNAWPRPRSRATLVHDPLRDRFYLYGGTIGGTELWELIPDEAPAWWRQLPYAPALSTSSHAAAFDPAVGRMVVVPREPGDLVAVEFDMGVEVSTEHLTRGMNALSGATGVFDPARREMILYGGRDELGALRRDVWTSSVDDAGDWGRALPPGTPQAREHHAAAWDPVRSRMWIFGGGPLLRSDLRALDRSGTPEWLTLAISGFVPTPRQRAALVFDAPRDRLILFGGDDGFPRNDLHAIPLSGANERQWAPLASSGAPPIGRYGMTMVHDTNADRLLVFGGRRGSTVYDDVWSLDLAAPVPQWSALAPLGTPPAPRYGHVAAFDPARHRVVVYGGAGPVAPHADAWELRLSGPAPEWRALALDGEAPAARVDLAGVLDPVRDRLLLFGGSGGTARYDDTWALEFAPATAVDEWEAASGLWLSPNPARDAIEVRFAASAPGRATLAVWDLAGRRVGTRAVQAAGPGVHRARLELGAAAAPGIYFATLDLNGVRRTARFTRVR